MAQNNDRASLQLRAQEIINANPTGISVRDAVKQALIERFGHDENALADFAATVTASSLTGLRKRTYELPDPDTQMMFEIPQVIGIRTQEGDLLVARDHADLDQVRQWLDEGCQHHATQHLRFKRGKAEVEPLKNEPGTLPWWSARHMLVQGDEGADSED